MEDKKEIPRRYAHIVKACDRVIRGLAGVAIIALVDEATGYQYDRAKDELSKILSAYISPKLLPWTQRFPHEFFRLVYKLYGWEYKAGTVKHPQYLGKFINKYVYGQMPSGCSGDPSRQKSGCPIGLSPLTRTTSS